MAEENPGWGYTRIRGALDIFGYNVGRTTIKWILNEHGTEPAAQRHMWTSWRTFLGAHWGAIAAMDFFTVEAVTLTGVVRYVVLIVIDLQSRRVEVAGTVASNQFSQLDVSGAFDTTGLAFELTPPGGTPVPVTGALALTAPLFAGFVWRNRKAAAG